MWGRKWSAERNNSVCRLDTGKSWRKDGKEEKIHIVFDIKRQRWIPECISYSILKEKKLRRIADSNSSHPFILPHSIPVGPAGGLGLRQTGETVYSNNFPTFLQPRSLPFKSRTLTTSNTQGWFLLPQAIRRIDSGNIHRLGPGTMLLEPSPGRISIDPFLLPTRTAVSASLRQQ